MGLHRIFLALAVTGVALGTAGCTKAKLINEAKFAVTAPTVTMVFPSSGPLTGGTSITITGTGFDAGSSVSIGGASCLSVSVVSPTQITCTTPAHSMGPKQVVVTNSSTLAALLDNAFNYTDAVSPVPGFTVTSGAGIMSGGGIRLEATIGQPTGPVRQSGTGLQGQTGIQGVLYDP